MPKINLKACLNCGVHAIVIEKGTKPTEEVECNNCHAIFFKKDLK